ncbi:MAG: DNA polymerase III subunit gamma/tau [Oscillospiraceae bacterium]|nr:DNA polymerase III subunit gamma/tau [Oscillospiraceae bacterium]
MYEALYRKYRPKTFDEVVGQEYITETLKNQVRTGRLSHAYLFIGTRGTGKTTCARILAKAVNCEHPVDGNPCNECASCRGIESGSVMDVVELDAASNNGVDDVRMLREEAIFSPTTVRKRVYIIDEVHMLSKPAFNALLKILEEPPQHLMFILATTELNKVLPTILSRCQRHSFRRLDSETIARRLAWVAGQEGIGLEEDAARLLGRMADGGMRDGLSLLDQCASRETVTVETVMHSMGLAGATRTLSLVSSAADGDVSSALEQYEALWQDGKEPAGLLGELSSLFRDVLLLRLAPENGRNLISGAYGEESLRSVPLSSSEIIRCLNIIQKYQASMVTAASPRLQGELCMIELCSRPGPAETPVAAAPAPGKPEKHPAPAPVRHAPPASPLSAEVAPAPPAEKAAPEPENPVPEPEKPVPVPAPEPSPSAPEDDAAWQAILDDLSGKIIFGTYILMTDPGNVTGALVGNELILRVRPGFETAMITTADNINKIRQSACAVTGKAVTVRVEELTPKPASVNEDKLAQLGQFGNVTIR